MRNLLANQTVLQCCVLLPTLHHHQNTSFLTAFGKCWGKKKKNNTNEIEVREMTIGEKTLCGGDRRPDLIYY